MPTAATTEDVRHAGDLVFRRASLDDAGWVADLMTARHPDEPADPVVQRHWWANDDPAWTIERWLVERGGRRIGFTSLAHAPFEQLDKRYVRIGVHLEPARDDAPTRSLVFDWIEARALDEGAEILTTGSREDMPDLVRFLEARGFREERRGKAWELDLVSGRKRLEAMAAASRARMREQRLTITTLDRDRDRDKYAKCHKMSEEASQDVPTTVPIVAEPLEQFMRWLSSPALREDRFWIAREGDDIVGLSVLEYPPIRGNVWTAWTATARKVRGRGIARALKLETVLQAAELGTKRVRTSNDGKNDPILHLNEQMGYARLPGGIQLHKRVAPAA